MNEIMGYNESKSNSFYLVDYENIGLEGIKDLYGIRPGDVLVIFYSSTHKNMTLDVIGRILDLNVELKVIEAANNTKNALDFQLSTYLGYLVGTRGKKPNYYIVSKDKGYDVICNYWQVQGVNVSRVLLKQELLELSSHIIEENVKAVPVKKEVKPKSKNEATLEEIKQYLLDEDMPEKVLDIFNKYKSKQAICNGITKECKDSKRGSAIYKKLKPLLKEKKKS